MGLVAVIWPMVIVPSSNVSPQRTMAGLILPVAAPRAAIVAYKTANVAPQ